jgi:hypothetical protein
LGCSTDTNAHYFTHTAGVAPVRHAFGATKLLKTTGCGVLRVHGLSNLRAMEVRCACRHGITASSQPGSAEAIACDMARAVSGAGLGTARSVACNLAKLKSLRYSAATAAPAFSPQPSNGTNGCCTPTGHRTVRPSRHAPHGTPRAGTACALPPFAERRTLKAGGP